MTLNIKDELNVDELSLKILALLQENSRMSNSEIGRQIGLSSPAVNDRIKKMERLGIIKKYTVEIDQKKLGFEIETYITVSLQGLFGPTLKETAKSFLKIPEVIEFYNVTGGDDIIMKIVASSIDHLRVVISKVAPLGRMYTKIIVTEFKKQSSIDIKEINHLSPDEEYFKIN
jgi:Lrp/AsnC family transcriptional regulator, leucine-responsive regulatory protein